MKPETLKKLDALARSAVDSIETEVEIGHMTPDAVRKAAASVKNPSRIEVVKALIRRDIKTARAAGAGDMPVYRDLVNIAKSAEQFNYLANTIDALTKRRAWSNASFRPVYEKLFGVKVGRAGKKS